MAKNKPAFSLRELRYQEEMNALERAVARINQAAAVLTQVNPDSMLGVHSVPLLRDDLREAAYWILNVAHEFEDYTSGWRIEVLPEKGGEEIRA